ERAGAPSLIPMELMYVAPVIFPFGTPEQKQRWLPDILESRALWAQGYAEPEAGSDLPSLHLSAVRDGDDYIRNCGKIMTTLAQWADWMFCLVRTGSGERKHDGISFVCFDIKSAGARIVPIITMNGAWELNRVGFDNVRVPVENRICSEGQGWQIANFLLQNERLSYAHIARRKVELQQLRKLATDWPGDNGCALLDSPLFAAKLAQQEIDVAV